MKRMTTLLGCLTLTFSLTAVPQWSLAAQKPQSDLQKEIKQKSEAEQRKKDQKELDRINQDLKKQGDWRKKHGPNADPGTTEKANDRTRELYGKKQQIEKRMNPPQEKPPAKSGSDIVRKQNEREQKVEERHSRTFGKGDNPKQKRG